MYKKNSHCSYCGTAFVEEQEWPRKCANCGKSSYLNPTPVAVTLVPVGDGLMVVRRGIEPRKGMLALPGGFINMGESWQEAGAREVWEETGLTLAPQEIEDFRVLSAPDGTVLIFGLAKPRQASELPPFEPNLESTELVILTQVEELAFPLHTQAIKEFFARKAARDV